MIALLLTHDLACATGELHAARSSNDRRIAAIAFTIQLAIDVGGRDPTEMRQLETDLLAKLSQLGPT